MKLKMTLGFSLLLCGTAMAQDVYPGCEVPTAVPGHRTFFIDPVNGSDTGDGSAKRPWRSLNTVLAPASKLIATKSHKTPSGSPLLAVNPNAPIKGGDTLMLMSGDFGDVTLMNSFNDKFITIMPAPGQKPVIQHLKVAGAARWAFQGLTFQSEYPSGAKQNANSMVYVNDGWGDSTKNIVFDQDIFQSTDDAQSWSNADWYSKPNFFALLTKATCVSVTNSTFRNLLNGMSVMGPQTLIKGNTIEKFSVDAIDAATGKVAIVGNNIKDGMYNETSDLHPDAIQVWSPRAGGKITTVNTDVLVDSNQIYMPKSLDGKSRVLQGITVSFCDGVVIQNNVISVNLWNAIYAGGLKNARIVNNTVVSSDPTDHPARIYVAPSIYNKSENVVVRNNVSNDIMANDQSITMDHNFASRTYSTLESGKVVWHPQGISSTKNRVLPSLSSNFRNFVPSQGGFDLHLKTASMLDGAGSQLLAPPVDAEGRGRTAPADVGAYSHQ